MKTIKIKEEFQIPGTDVILEEGDTIQVFREAYIPSEDDVWNIVQGFKDGKKFYRNKDMYEPEVEELLDSRYTSEGDFEQSVMQMFNLEEAAPKMKRNTALANKMEDIISDLADIQNMYRNTNSPFDLEGSKAASRAVNILSKVNWGSVDPLNLQSKNWR